MARRRGLLARIIVNLVFSSATVGVAYAQPTAVPSGNAPGSGLTMYYEIHGAIQDVERPLILIEGGADLSGMFGAIMPELAKNRHAIAADLETQGRRADIDRLFSFEALEDVAAFVLRLSIENVDVMGYSFGGELALRVAIPHPGIVRKLVAGAAIFHRDSCIKELRACFPRVKDSRETTDLRSAVGADSGAERQHAESDRIIELFLRGSAERLHLFRRG
ncbi:alpha/beta fold hydrolase [Alloacidobacterium dinghuense]|uniref:alpha/beta fold hydrolase n=1 Tax=Alloacidobacterium dinghuense TaxID=2763107 RepID=UPI002036D85E|nr:alpha/beta fold hydrolase [Alloacidobacterium dinghuense]